MESVSICGPSEMFACVCVCVCVCALKRERGGGQLIDVSHRLWRAFTNSLEWLVDDALH